PGRPDERETDQRRDDADDEVHGDYPIAGSRMVTGEPCPGDVSSVIVPPWAATIERAIERPSPAPPLARSRAASRRTNGSKTRVTSPGAMPGPVSRTLRRPLPFARATLTSTRPPARAEGSAGCGQ